MMRLPSLSAFVGTSATRSWKLQLFATAIVTSSALILYWRYRRQQQQKERQKFPPGPPCRAFLGPRGFEDKERWVVFVRWSDEYRSDIIYASMWPLLPHMFILNSHAALRDALLGADSGDALAARPESAISEMLNPGNCGLIFANGARFREQRRWALHTLRDFGLGKNLMEKAIIDELLDLRKLLEARIASNNEAAIDTTIPVVASVANVMSAIVFGERLGGDPEFERMRNIIDFIVQFSSSQILPFLLAPILIHMPGDTFGLKKFLETENELKRYLGRKMQSHKASFDPNNLRDYIDCFIREEILKQDSGEQHFFNEAQLVRSLYDLFIAGMETTSTTLRWALLLMASFPEIQEKVRAEIIEQIGRDRLPQYADRLLLPFTEAVLCEVHRFVTIVPSGVAHSAERETRVREYTIPKDSLIIANLYAIHRQADLWPDPHHFNPEANFVKRSNGNAELKNTEFLVPFGVGKRQCLGEPLARQEQFLFFVGLLQHFRVSPVKGKSLPPVSECVPGVTRQPLPHELHFSIV